MIKTDRFKKYYFRVLKKDFIFYDKKKLVFSFNNSISIKFSKDKVSSFLFFFEYSYGQKPQLNFSNKNVAHFKISKNDLVAMKVSFQKSSIFFFIENFFLFTNLYKNKYYFVKNNMNNIYIDALRSYSVEKEPFIFNKSFLSNIHGHFNFLCDAEIIFVFYSFQIKIKN